MHLASALWTRLRRHGRQVWLTSAREAWWDRRDLPVAPNRGTLIAVGELGHEDLKAVSRWVERDGCSAVAVGTFPRGWRARAPGVGSGQMARHLSVAGLPAKSAQRLVGDRNRRFEALSAADRNGVTDTIRSILTTRMRRRSEPHR
jgi:hypothetical protein